MAPDCFPVQGMEEREEEGNLENVGLSWGVFGGEIHSGWKLILSGNSFWVEIHFEWKFMGKFAHGLGSANSFHVVKRSRLGGHSQSFFF